MQEILGPDLSVVKAVEREFAYKTPHVSMRLDWRGVPYKKGYDTGPALEWDARQATYWAATMDALAEVCGTARTDVARRLGSKGFPSSPYRIRLYRGTHQFW